MTVDSFSGSCHALPVVSRTELEQSSYSLSPPQCWSDSQHANTSRPTDIMTSLIDSYLLSCATKSHDVIETSDGDDGDDGDDHDDCYEKRLAGASTVSVRLDTLGRALTAFYLH